MEYRIRATGDVMSEIDLRRWAKDSNGPSWNQTTPEILAELNVDPVLESPQPTITRYQLMFRDGVENINGSWYTKYRVADMGAEAIAAKDAEQAKSVRSIRNQHLKDCDWTQGKDVPDAVSTPWAAYRQQLRDLPKQAGFPWDVEWPKQP